MSKKARCTFCRKKLGLINYQCKCMGVFCSLHRYTHSHNCTYIEKKKEDSKNKIKEQNPKTESTTPERIN